MPTKPDFKLASSSICNRSLYSDVSKRTATLEDSIKAAPKLCKMYRNKFQSSYYYCCDCNPTAIYRALSHQTSCLTLMFDSAWAASADTSQQAFVALPRVSWRKPGARCPTDSSWHLRSHACCCLLLLNSFIFIHIDWLLSSPAVEQSQRPRQPWPGISHCSDICYSTMTSQTYQNGWALYRCFFAWTTSIYRCRHPNCIIAE